MRAADSGRRDRSVEHHSVEAMACEEAMAFIELDGLFVSFGDREGDGSEADASQVMDAMIDECSS